MWTEIHDNFHAGDADEWLSSAKNLGKCGYLLRVSGKSMHAPGERFSYPKGMILHVNPGMTPQPGQFVIVRRGAGLAAATFKRYVLMDGNPYLEAINPNWPPDEKYIKLHPHRPLPDAGRGKPIRADARAPCRNRRARAQTALRERE